MHFDGRVWFDFSNRAVWDLYRFVRAFVEAGNEAALEWIPLYLGSETHAMAMFMGLGTPGERGLFLHAMLGLVHTRGADPNDHETVRRAFAAAGLFGSRPVAVDVLETLAAGAAALGVTETPTIHRHGPVMHVVLNEAASMGDTGATARSILSVLDDDGIWKLAKP